MAAFLSSALLFFLHLFSVRFRSPMQQVASVERSVLSLLLLHAYMQYHARYTVVERVQVRVNNKLQPNRKWSECSKCSATLGQSQPVSANSGITK